MTPSLEPGALVIVSLHTPREKVWGVLLSTGPAGVVVRGVDLNAFEDWLSQEAKGGEPMLGPTTVFFPMARVERVERDERLGVLPSLSDRFLQKVGREPAAALGWVRPTGRRPGTPRRRGRRG